ncbi:DUF4232 domain-containing protein [Streptomyces pactum]|uniref:DUF4232 domain-containing protein n=1 Tax=Streptomyces pactum TaxID=68249 RepID=A0ABS0NUE9_9ACTN|nr:DUF4232 domain-containing protein [Streptomyces pactum]MBH5333990.1 DUF4232 domain-containing protein [Streptomyces pactum]MBH5338826.1 DUF4232 domain-containing protein [Streptomyces pactum]
MKTSARPPHRGRGHRRTCVAGAALIAALLGATACESDGDDGANGSATTDRPSASTPAEPGASSSAEPDAKTPAATGGPGPATSRGTGSTEPGGSSGATRTGGDRGGTAAAKACAPDALAVSATKEPADSKEARHLLLTVQNAGDTACELYHYPRVRLGADARTTVPVIPDSDPDPGVPVTIAPGEEAYAALLVSGGARDEYEATSLTLSLQGPEPGSGAGGPIDVPMPVQTLYADDGQLVTHWTTASGLALDFIMSR